MPNMAHCRFQNTLLDLRDCYEHMDDDDLSDEEKDARQELLELCDRIGCEEFGRGNPGTF
jgi:hypothetical protein